MRQNKCISIFVCAVKECVLYRKRPLQPRGKCTYWFAFICLVVCIYGTNTYLKSILCNLIFWLNINNVWVLFRCEKVWLVNKFRDGQADPKGIWTC